MVVDGEQIDTKVGVPQGAVLSPTLFNVFINDLWNDIPEYIELFAFADDLVFIIEGEDNLDEVIDALEYYCDINKLEVNHKKSGLMMVRVDRRTRGPEKFPVDNYRNYPLVTDYQYLGVTINDTLGFKEDLEDRRKKEKYLQGATKVMKSNNHSPMANYQLWQTLLKSRVWY